MRPKNLTRDYGHHEPRSIIEAQDHENVRARCRDLATLFEELPEGREKSLAHTKLEEAMMWANAALARGRYDEDNQETVSP